MLNSEQKLIGLAGLGIAASTVGDKLIVHDTHKYKAAEIEQAYNEYLVEIETPQTSELDMLKARVEKIETDLREKEILQENDLREK